MALASVVLNEVSCLLLTASRFKHNKNLNLQIDNNRPLYIQIHFWKQKCHQFEIKCDDFSQMICVFKQKIRIKLWFTHYHPLTKAKSHLFCLGIWDNGKSFEEIEG